MERKKWQPTPVSLAEKAHVDRGVWRAAVAESETTEHLQWWR